MRPLASQTIFSRDANVFNDLFLPIFVQTKFFQQGFSKGGAASSAFPRSKRAVGELVVAEARYRLSPHNTQTYAIASDRARKCFTSRHKSFQVAPPMAEISFFAGLKITKGLLNKKLYRRPC